MKTLKSVFRVCLYQIRRWADNLRIYIVLLCIFIFLSTYLIPVRNFINAVNEPATPFILPLLLSNGFLSAILFLGVILLFCNAPFYDSNQIFILMRTDKIIWAYGQVLYIVFTSVFYMVCLVAISILVLLPDILLRNEWGRIWTTLASTDASVQFLIPFQVNYAFLINYKPVQAMTIILVMGTLICCLFGFLLWILNLYIGKNLSIFLALASVLLTIRVDHLSDWIKYIVPVSWLNLNSMSKYASHGLTVAKAMVILIILDGILLISSVGKTVSSDMKR